MAAAPVFAATPKVGAGLVPATLDVSLTAPTNVTTILTGGANGTKVEEIVMQGVGTLVAGVVNVFLHDGTTYHLVDQFVIPATTSSTTLAAWRAARTYANLILPSASWTLRVAQTIVTNVSLVKVTALAGDF